MTYFHGRFAFSLARVLTLLLAIGLLGALAAILFPIYWPYLHPLPKHTGRPDYEQEFQVALARDHAGGISSAEKIYRRVIESTGTPPDCPYCPNLTVPQDSPHLKARAYVAIGVKRVQRNDRKGALEAFHEGAQREPDDAINAFYLGYGLAKMGDNPEAKACFLQASTLGDAMMKKRVQSILGTLPLN